MGTVVVLASLVLAIILFVVLSRQAVVEGRAFNALRPFYLLLFPPRDLYRPLLDLPIDVGQRGTYTVEFTNPYVGRYAFVFEVQAAVEMASKGYTYDGYLTIRVSQAGRDILSWNPGRNLIPYWSSSGSGFILAHYDVPRDMPRGTQLQCMISEEQGAPAFAKQYGATRLKIVKVSEK